MINKKRGFTPLEVGVYRQKHKKNKLLTGFTLIELLVAIAIIGILAGLLITGMTKARQKALQSRAIQSFSQIALAMQLYYDKNGSWPNPLATPGFTTHSCSGTYGCIADFADDSDPDNKFYPAWDAPWYCSSCKYSFVLYDFSNPRDGKPDIGYISIQGIWPSTSKFVPCITSDTKYYDTEYCGEIYP